MDDDEPPNFTIRVYRTIIGQYYPIVISNNGDKELRLENFSNKNHILGIYKVRREDFDVFYDLCKTSFGKSNRFVKKRIEELVNNGKK